MDKPTTPPAPKHSSGDPMGWIESHKAEAGAIAVGLVAVVAWWQKRHASAPGAATASTSTSSYPPGTLAPGSYIYPPSGVTAYNGLESQVSALQGQLAGLQSGGQAPAPTPPTPAPTGPNVTAPPGFASTPAIPFLTGVQQNQGATYGVYTAPPGSSEASFAQSLWPTANPQVALSVLQKYNPGVPQGSGADFSSIAGDQLFIPTTNTAPVWNGTAGG